MSPVDHLQRGLKEIHGPFLGECKTKLDKIKDLATRKAAEFKNSSLIPRSSRLFLEDMAKETDLIHTRLKRSLEDSEGKIKAALEKLGVKT